ncbi:MAG: protein YgfX [Dyella sp.]
MSSAPAIGFEYRPSRHLAAALNLILALAWIAIALSGLALWLQSALALAVLAAWFGQRALDARLPLRALALSGDSQWQLHLTHGDDLPARLLSSRVLGEYIVLWLAVADRGRHGVLLGPDNLDSDSRRRLRMRLAGGNASERPAAL